MIALTNEVSMNPITKKEIPRVIELLCGCFEQDPHTQWFIGNPTNPQTALRRRRALLRYVTVAAQSCQLAFLDADGQAAVLWQEWGNFPCGLAFIAANLNYLWHCGIAGTNRSLAMEKAAAQNLPKGPYLFLWLVGVAPQARGQGRLRAIIQTKLDAAKAAGQSVFLETTVPKNVEIYQHFGFQVIKRYSIADSPEVIVMQRRPD